MLSTNICTHEHTHPVYIYVCIEYGMSVYTQYMYLHDQMTSHSHAHNSYLPVIGVHEMQGRMLLADNYFVGS